MISLIIGENSFENERIRGRLIAEFGAKSEIIDGETLDLKRLPDLLMGTSLFATKRFILIKNMSANKVLWGLFETWIPRVSDDIHLVLMDAKPDKRTKTYKELQKSATVYETKLWGERDTFQAEQWVMEEAKRLDLSLGKKSAHALVSRAGVDQWVLWQALQKLAVVDKVTPEVIEELIEANPVENVFNLFEAALRSDGTTVRQMLDTLVLSEDPYRLFGLLSGQAFQLAVLSVAAVPSAEVARAIGAHPFAVSKLASHAERLGAGRARKIIAAFGEADSGMKTSVGDPWLLIERALIKTARASI